MTVSTGAALCLDAIELLYGASLDAGVWANWLKKLTRDLGGDHALLLVGQNGQEGSFAYGLDHGTLARFTCGEAMVLGRPYYDQLPEGRAICSAEMVSDTEMRRLPFYNEVLRSAGGFRGISLRQREGSPFVLNICRGSRSRDFSETERRYLQALRPHLANVLRIEQRVQEANARTEAILDLLNHGREAMLLVDGQARAVHCNALAEALVARNGGLSLRGGFVSAGASTTGLRRAIQQAARSRGAGEPMSLTVDHVAGEAPLRLRLTGLPHGLPGGVFEGAQVAIFAEVPASHLLDRDLLRSRFRITPRESDVCQAVADGLTVAQVARALGLSPWTVRHHLKLLFLKTNTRSQIALARLLRDFERC